MGDEKNIWLALSELALIPVVVLFLAVYVIVFPFLFIYSLFIPEGPGDIVSGLIPGLDEFIQ